MSKFCANCGKEMADTDNVCSNCGTPIGGAAPAANKPLEGQYKTFAIVSLVCGIASLVLCWSHWIMSIVCLIVGIVAIVFSVKAKKGGKSGMATAGLVTGIIGVVLSAIAVCCLGCAACLVCAGKDAINNIANNMNTTINWNDINWD